MSKPRILFSVPTRHHVEIALDELEGMQELGYACSQFPYAAKEGVTSQTGRLKVIVSNALALVKIARNFKPDIIYFNSRLEVLAGLRDFITIAICKALYRGKVRFVIKSHGSDLDVLHSKQSLMQKVVLPFLKRNVAGWLFLSSEEKRKVDEIHYFRSDKIFVTKNIVRLGHFEKDDRFKSKLNIPQHHKVLLFVGRLIKEKGIYEVLNAFAAVKNSYASTLIVVGWGSDLDTLKELAVSLQVDDRVIFTGFIPEQDVVAYYANCDILVFPTYFPEGFPMALFNSVAAGMAVVTTPTRAATDYLSEPENCIWVESQNAGSVSTGLTQLLNNEGLATTMQANNTHKGIEFGKEQVCAELATIVEQIMQQ
jgi:glycosyltransferase involved in cell wall biosynthesis